MKSHLFFFVTILFGSLADILSKWLVFAKYKHSGYIEIISGFFGIICSLNKGIAFGFFPTKSNALIYFTIFAILLIVWIYFYSDKSSILNTIGLAVMLSGAIGNLWDRIYYHSVRDFIDVHIGNYHWPTFNIADLLICVGVGLVLLRNVKTKKNKIKTN